MSRSSPFDRLPFEHPTRVGFRLILGRTKVVWSALCIVLRRRVDWCQRCFEGTAVC